MLEIENPHSARPMIHFIILIPKLCYELDDLIVSILNGSGLHRFHDLLFKFGLARPASLPA